MGEILVDETTAVMDRGTLDRLLEYSCSVPTGVTLGKRWKRGWCKCVDRGLRRYGSCRAHDTWSLGEYVSGKPGHALITWRRILVV